jgi:arginyl-tRNA--protein-N-Asp/Glu arginylyltransferase
MESLFRYVAPPSPCGYLPDQRWSLEYEMVTAISAEEYQLRLEQGWRRFGGTLFRPQCPACQACRSLRVVASRFRPNRSQRRTRKTNETKVALHVGPPSVTRAKLSLYDRFHAFQSKWKGWPLHPAKDPESYRESFVHNPRFTEEWCYVVADRLVGVGYVDRLPDCLSAIYFFADPDERWRGLGTYNVLCVLAEAARRRLPHVYLGYFVAGCSSLEYKANFKPNQIFHADGLWRDYLGGSRE